MHNLFRTILFLLYSSLILIIVLLVLFLTYKPEPVVSQQQQDKPQQTAKISLSPEATEGYVLFKKSGCVTCHDVCKKKVGPALKEVTKRRKREWIYAFVRNSGKMIEQKDPVALAVYEENSKSDMPAHDFLSPEDIDKILHYLETSPCGQP